MVRVAVEPHAAGCGALGAAFVFAFRLEEIGHALDLALPVFERRGGFVAFLVEHIGRENNLVEKIPGTLVHQRPRTLLGENVVPRVVHIVLPHLVDILLGRQDVIHALVVRVIIHITHDDNLAVGCLGLNAFLQRLNLRRAHLTVVRPAETAGQVVDNDHDMLACHHATHGQKAAGAEIGVLLLSGDIGIELHVLHREKGRLIEQRTIDAAMVGPLDMTELVATGLQGWLGTEVCEHLSVLHLTQANGRAAHTGQRGGGHVAEGSRHVVELMTVFQAVPMVGTIRKILVIVLAHIVTRVKQVLLVVEANGIDRELLLCRCRKEQHQHGKQSKQLSFHPNL